MQRTLGRPMATKQSTNPPQHGQVLQFPRNDSYLKGRQIEGGPPPPGGNPPPPPTSGGGEPPLQSGGHEVTIATLQQKVNGAFLWLSLLTVAFGVAFLYTMGKVDDRFDKLDQPIREIQASISGQTATLKAIDDRLSRTETKMDANDDRKSEASPR